MNRLEQLHWRLITGMGALALIWALFDIAGMMGGVGWIVPALLISTIWLAIVVLFQVREPLLTLIFTGIAHGLFAIILSVVVLPILTGEVAIPIANPFAVIAMLLTNALWGLVIGVIALAIQK